MKPYIIIDSHYLCYRAHYTTGDFSFAGYSTGIIFGFLIALKDLSEKFNTSNFVFCWDSPLKKNKRKLIYPGYKKRPPEKEASNKEDKKEAHAQMAFIRDEFLPNLGYKNIFIKDGYEGDDLIADIVKRYRKEYEWIIIASDNDLYQLLSDTVTIYDVARKRIIDSAWLKKKWGIEPSRWVDVKAIAGCKSDEVKGIQGIKEKTAINYLNGNLNQKSVAFQKIKDSGKLIKQNYKLVVLPFDDLEGGIKLFRPEKFLNKDYFAKSCAKYGFKNLKFESFIKALNLK